MKNPLFEVMTTAEADRVWNLAKDTTRRFCNFGSFKEDEARKSSEKWLVTKEGMRRVFGEPRPVDKKEEAMEQ